MPGYSLSLLQYYSPGGFKQELSKPFMSGAYVSGAQKLVQNFAAELLTRRGSVRFDPTYGSRLPDEFQQGNIVAVEDLRGALARSINDVVMNMAARERIEDTPDELLAAANLDTIEQKLDRVIARIILTTEAGTSLIYNLPIELNNYD